MKTQVLIVEDEALIAADIEDRLVGLGYEVSACCDSYAEAVQWMEKNSPDLVILDIHLRGAGTGIDLARQLRSKYQVPFVFLTAYVDPETLREAQTTEPAGYLVKPLQTKDIIATLEIARYRHQAEVDQKKMERWLATTLESIGDGVIAVDSRGRVTFINPIAQTLSGWTSVEAIGQPFERIFRLIDERTQSSQIELVKDCLTQGKSVHLAEGFCILTKTGEMLPIDDSIAPIRQEGTEGSGIVIVFRDRTRRQQLENERAAFERHLFESQRLDSIGMLASGIAHDFNNLLTIMRGNTEFCAEMQVPRQAGYLADMQEAIRRGSDLCDQMLAYAGQAPLARKPVNLTQLVEGTVQMVQRLRSNCAYHLQPCAQKIWVLGDSRQLQQVVLNLLVNGADAIESSQGKVSVALSISEDTAQLEVRDDGVGMEPEVAQKIFEPFFSTKQHGRGLGLAAVAGFIRSHNGTIKVESQPGLGSCFRIGLPAVPPPEPLNKGPETDPRKTRILVVDDEDSLRRLVERGLSRQGYLVSEACNGAEGLELLRSRPFDLVILDIIMPVLGGREVLEILRNERPELPVLMISGYDPSSVPLQGVAFLAKPFGIAVLVEKVAQLLASAPYRA
jgi:two-component system cell cycle sensor histidine kinase/response regulator CckA